eukprot:3376235-Ditylum_brightwellii.AAC.1
MDQMMNLFTTMLQAMQQSQQQTKHLQESNPALEETLANITEITCLQAEATKTAAEKSRRSREEKGPSDTKFPHFGNKTTENVTAWYNSILSKLSIAAWNKLYDKATNDVITQTTDDTQSLSNHFFFCHTQLSLWRGN